MRRPVATLLLGAFLTAAFLPALAHGAAYTPLRGQTLNIVKPSINASNVTMKGAVVESVSTQELTVSVFGLTYKIDLAGAGANVSGLALGSKVDIVGLLDVNNTTMVHATSIQGSGITGGNQNTGTGSTTGLCASGSENSDQGGMVEAFGEPVAALVRQALGCSSNWTLKAPPDAWRYQGTPNYKILWRTWYYGWAMRAGTEAQKIDARDFLAEFFDRQASEGHMFGEALTTSHYQIWIHGATAARLLAFKYQDQKLLNATGKWWRKEFGTYDLLVRENVIYSPGFRIPQGFGPTSQLRNVVYALVKDKPLQINPGNGTNPPGGPGIPTSNWWKDYYNVGAWTLKNLLQLGDNLGGAAQAKKETDLPVLVDQLCAYSKGNDFVFLFPKMNGLDRLFWVARIGGTVTKSPYSPGYGSGTSPTAAPSLAGATLTTIKGIGTNLNCPTDSGGGGGVGPGPYDY